eukprot:UN09476
MLGMKNYKDTKNTTNKLKHNEIKQKRSTKSNKIEITIKTQRKKKTT